MHEEGGQDGNAAASNRGDPDGFRIIAVNRRRKGDGRCPVRAVQHQPIVLSGRAELDDRMGGKVLGSLGDTAALEIAGRRDNAKVDLAQLLIADFR